jgi:hypothetical protein
MQERAFSHLASPVSAAFGKQRDNRHGHASAIPKLIWERCWRLEAVCHPKAKVFVFNYIPAFDR